MIEGESGSDPETVIAWNENPYVDLWPGHTEPARLTLEIVDDHDPPRLRCGRCGQVKDVEDFMGQLCEVCDKEVRLGAEL